MIGLVITQTALILYAVEHSNTGTAIEELARQFKQIRKIKGHFNGGVWNDDVDRWLGQKHKLMMELGSRLPGNNYRKNDIIKLLDPPDQIAAKGDDLFALIITRKEYAGMNSGSYEFLIYYWRGKHDFLFFTCRKDAVIKSGWWYAGD